MVEKEVSSLHVGIGEDGERMCVSAVWLARTRLEVSVGVLGKMGDMNMCLFPCITGCRQSLVQRFASEYNRRFRDAIDMRGLVRIVSEACATSLYAGGAAFPREQHACRFQVPEHAQSDL